MIRRIRAWLRQRNQDQTAGNGGQATPVDITELLERLRHVRRTAWVPTTEDGDGEEADSKFSGRPLLSKGEPWPTCPNCHLPMQLFVQLNRRDLPAQAGVDWGAGLLQFFYCTTGDPLCEVDCEAWAPDSRSTLLRIQAVEGPFGSRAAGPEAPFPAKRIVSWRQAPDYPGWDERGDHGIDLTDPEDDLLIEEGFPLGGEKLGGWPAWVQGVEYPTCGDCGELMRMILQIDSEHNLPYMFGDVGCGHIFQCPHHVDRLAFGWACS